MGDVNVERIQQIVETYLKSGVAAIPHEDVNELRAMPVDALVASLRDSDPQVKIICLTMLNERNDLNLIPVFVRVLKEDTNEHVRAEAAFALGNIIDPCIAEGVISLDLSNPNLFTSLVSAFETDPSMQVRRLASEALVSSARIHSNPNYATHVLNIFDNVRRGCCLFGNLREESVNRNHYMVGFAMQALETMGHNGSISLPKLAFYAMDMLLDKDYGSHAKRILDNLIARCSAEDLPKLMETLDRSSANQLAGEVDGFRDAIRSRQRQVSSQATSGVLPGSVKPPRIKPPVLTTARQRYAADQKLKARTG